MFGVAINAAGVFIGGIIGLFWKQQLSAEKERLLRAWMALAMICIGLYLTWKNVSGSFVSILKQIFIVLISMSLGKILGRLLRLQKISNAAGRYASEKMKGASPNRFNDGFIVATILACVNPLGLFASAHEAFGGFSAAFVAKAFVDGLAAMSFVPLFGWGVILSAIPVLAFQGTLVLLLRMLEPWLHSHGLVESVLATDGLLIFSVSLVIMNVKKIELADYLPSLAVAPLITFFWK